MQRSQTDADRLLVLTLVLESAIQDRDWKQVSELFAARKSLMEDLSSLPKETLEKIGVVEERMLTSLRKGLVSVRGDLRNLSAALKIAGPYSRNQRSATFSLAS